MTDTVKPADKQAGLTVECSECGERYVIPFGKSVGSICPLCGCDRINYPPLHKLGDNLMATVKPADDPARLRDFVWQQVRRTGVTVFYLVAAIYCAWMGKIEAEHRIWWLTALWFGAGAVLVWREMHND